MSIRRAAKTVALSAAALGCAGATTMALAGTAGAATGPGASGNTITNALQPTSPYTLGTPFDSGQVINVVIPANTVLTPGASIFILECAAPNGVDPTTTGSCDGNTNYGGGTISVNSDGSIDLEGLSLAESTGTGMGYTVYALPDNYSLQESPTSSPVCGNTLATECVLYVGQGGGGDIGMTLPHFFTEAFTVNTDATDSGTISPGDGTGTGGPGTGTPEVPLAVGLPIVGAGIAAGAAFFARRRRANAA